MKNFSRESILNFWFFCFKTKNINKNIWYSYQWYKTHHQKISIHSSSSGNYRKCRNWGRSIYIPMLFAGDWGKIIIKDCANVQENCTPSRFSREFPDCFRRIGAHWSWCDYSFGAHWQKLFGWDEFAVVMDNAKIETNVLLR